MRRKTSRNDFECLSFMRKFSFADGDNSAVYRFRFVQLQKPFRSHTDTKFRQRWSLSSIVYDLLSNISLCTLHIGLTVLQIKVYAMRISIPLFVCGSKFPKSHKSSRTCCYFYSWGSVDDACLLQTHSIFGLVVYTFFKFILCGTFLCIVRCLFCIHFGLFLFLPHTRFLFLSRNQPKSMF